MIQPRIRRFLAGCMLASRPSEATCTAALSSDGGWQTYCVGVTYTVDTCSRSYQKNYSWVSVQPLTTTNHLIRFGCQFRPVCHRYGNCRVCGRGLELYIRYLSREVLVVHILRRHASDSCDHECGHDSLTFQFGSAATCAYVFMRTTYSSIEADL